MRTAVRKFLLNSLIYETVEMPKDARILAVSNESGSLVLFAIVDVDQKETEERQIVGVVSNQECEFGYLCGMIYIGNVFNEKWSYTMHFFERI